MKIFIEEQKFNQPLIFIGLSIAFIVVAGATYSDWNAVENEILGSKIAALSGLLILLLVAILFLFLKLKTRIDEKGIHYQFFPFQLKFKTISWDLIAKCYVRKYEALTEYGGWGMKFSFFKKRGKCVTAKGNIGLQLELKNGKKLLIGTQLNNEIQSTIETYHHKWNHEK